MAQELYGDAGGLLALALWCFDPNILAFAAVVTADVPATVGGLCELTSFRKYLHTRSWEAATVAGAALGVALLTKHTLVLLFGILPMMWLFDRLRNRRSGNVTHAPRRVARHLGEH